MDYRELFHSIWGYQVSKTDYIVTKKKFIIVHRTSCSADPSCFADLCLALCAVTLKRGSAAPGREPFYIVRICQGTAKCQKLMVCDVRPPIRICNSVENV